MKKLICLLLTSAFFLTTAFATRAEESQFEKASISFRVGFNIWNDDERFAQLLDLFDANPGVTDEITFFTQSTHAPITDEELERRCVVLKERIAASKSRGYRAGINILCTIGQHPEDMPRSIGAEIPRAVSLDGRPAQATLCMNTDAFKARIRRIYAAMADAEPDYIWIDDDVRTGHWLDSSGSGGSLCYCDECLKRMTRKFVDEGDVEGFDGTLTREFIAARTGDARVLKKIREFYSDSVDELFKLIEEVVHERRPDIALGFMTGERYDEGYDFARWARALAGADGSKPVYWRPGGGFYDHGSAYALFGKSHEIGRQVSLLPSNVAVVQSEIENFPYQQLAKASHITCLEAASHIGAGCSGAAFNVLTSNEEPLDDYESIVRTIARWRPFYDLAVKYLGRRPNVGVFPLWERTDGNYPNRAPVQQLTSGVAEIGVPIAYAFSPEDSDVVLLSREYISHKSPEEIAAIFERGVYTDVNAVNLANDPNTYALNDLTGMEYGGVINVDGIERFEDRALNGRFAGRTRDLRQSFWREPMFALHKTRPGVETASSAVDYGGERTAETIVGLYENPRGGRVCVNGYFPWTNFYNNAKESQMREVMRWLSRDRLPGYVDSFCRALLWIRKPDESGKTAALAINANYDPAENFALKLRTKSDSIDVYDARCEKQTIQAESVDGAYKRFVVPEVKPWEPILIVIEDADF